MVRYTAAELMRQGKTVITAHSGCEGTPDNSMEHVRAAIASGAEMLEVDLRMANDGTLYLSHDAPEDISKRPQLTDLLGIIAATDGIGVNLDAKEEGLVAPAMEVVRAFGLTGRVIFTGSCTHERALAASLGTDVWRNLADGESIEDGLACILEDGSPCLNVRYSLITKAHQQLLQSRGKGFSAWTLNDEDSLRRYLGMGVVNVTTRRPVLAVKLRKEIQGV